MSEKDPQHDGAVRCGPLMRTSVCIADDSLTSISFEQPQSDRQE